MKLCTFCTNCFRCDRGAVFVSCFLICIEDVLSHRALLYLLPIHYVSMYGNCLAHEVLSHTASSYIEVAAICKPLLRFGTLMFLCSLGEQLSVVVALLI